jgi:hypothetical protein
MDAPREHFKTPYAQQFVRDSAENIDGYMQVQWLVMSTEYQPSKR